jgi:aspartate racemase
MKALGIIGGVGPESTIEYYRRIMGGCRARNPEGRAPSIFINSIDNAKVLDLIEAQEYGALVGYLWAEVQRLQRAGAELALIAANTPHLVFDELAQVSPVPLIDIVAAAATVAKAHGLRRLALFGTRFTMRGAFYPKRFSAEQIELILPDDSEQEYIHDKYMTELLRGVIVPATRDRLTSIVEAMKGRTGIDGVILGGTELSLIFREPAVAGVPVLDTTQIHVDAAVTSLIG